MPNYYVTKQQGGELVEEGHPDAAFLVYAEGSEVDDDRINEFGADLARELRSRLRAGRKEDKAEEAAAKVEEKAENKAIEDKAVQGPPENKAAGRSR